MTHVLQPGQQVQGPGKKGDKTADTVVTKPLSPVTAVAPVLKPPDEQWSVIKRQRTAQTGQETAKQTAPTSYTSFKSAVAPLRKTAEAIAFAEFEDFENQDIKQGDEKRKQAIEEGTQQDTSEQHETGVGKAATIKQTTTVRTGAKRETGTLAAEGLAGARAAAKTMLVSSDEELAATLQFLAQAGVFGKAEMKYDVKKGQQALSLSTKASGGAGAQVTGGGAFRIDYLVPAIVAVFEVSAKAGAWGELESSVEYRFKDSFFAGLKSSISGFAGAMASAKSEMSLKPKSGLTLSGEATAMAGVKGEAKTTATIGIKNVGELELEGGVMGFAGAEAEAAFKAQIGLSGVSLSAKASAFAGAKATVSGSGTVKLRGREVIKAKAEASVTAGAGAEAEFEFTFSHGKVSFKAKAGLTLGVGADVGTELEIDFEALAEAILGLIADQWNKQENKIDQKGLDYLRTPLKDPEEIKAKQQAGYKAVIDGFDDYASEVLAAVKKNKLPGRQVLEPSRMQSIIQDAAGRLDRRYKETDQGIVQAAHDAFGELLKPGGFVVDALVVRACGSVSPKEAKGASDRFDTLEKVKKARDGLKRDLIAYGNASRAAKGEEGISKPKVQKIITSHFKEMQEAFPGAEVKTGIALAVGETLGGFLGRADDGSVSFAVDEKGVITTFGKDETELKKLAKGEKETFAKNVSEQKANAAYAALAAELKQYKAGVLASEKADFSGVEVAKIIGKHTPKIPAERPKDEVKQKLQQIVMAVFDPFVMGVFFTDTLAVEKLSHNVGKLRDEQRKQAKQKRDTAHSGELDKFATAIAGKRQSLLKSGGTPADFIKQIESFTAKSAKACATNLAKIETEKDLTKFNTEIEAVLNKELDPLCVISLAGGAPKVTVVSADAVFKEERQKLKMTIKGGENADNERRALVAKALRGEFSTYGNELRAALQQQVDAKTGAKQPKAPPAGVDKAKLQGIITARTKAIEVDIKGKVGDDAVVDAAATAFGLEGYEGARGPFLLKKFSVENLQIKQFEAAKLSELASSRKQEHEDFAAEKQVIDKVRTEVQKYLKGLKPGAAIDKDYIQAIIERVAIPGLRTDTKEAFDRADLVIAQAVLMGAGGRIEKFKTELGFIKEFQAIGEQSKAAQEDALKRLKRELSEYAAICATTGYEPYKPTVQSSIDTYVKALAALKVPVDDVAVAQLVKEALGLTGTIELKMGKIFKWQLAKPVKPKAVKQ